MLKAGADPVRQQLVKRHALDRRARPSQPVREGGGESTRPRAGAARSSPPRQPGEVTGRCPHRIQRAHLSPNVVTHRRERSPSRRSARLGEKAPYWLRPRINALLATAAHKRSDLCAAHPDGRPGAGPRASQQVAECECVVDCRHPAGDCSAHRHGSAPGPEGLLDWQAGHPFGGQHRDRDDATGRRRDDAKGSQPAR